MQRVSFHVRITSHFKFRRPRLPVRRLATDAHQILEQRAEASLCVAVRSGHQTGEIIRRDIGMAIPSPAETGHSPNLALFIEQSHFRQVVRRERLQPAPAMRNIRLGNFREQERQLRVQSLLMRLDRKSVV